MVRLREQDQQLARLLGQQGLHCSDFDCLDVTEVQLLVNNDSTERFRSYKKNKQIFNNLEHMDSCHSNFTENNLQKHDENSTIHYK